MISLCPNRNVRRGFAYGCLALGLLLIGPPIRRSDWFGSGQLHTLIETATTLLGLTTGAMALVRYYTKKSSAYLLLAVVFWERQSSIATTRRSPLRSLRAAPLLPYPRSPHGAVLFLKYFCPSFCA